VSISSTFFEQLVHAQIPKVQKDNDDLTVFLHSGSAGVKALRKTLMKSTKGKPGPSNKGKIVFFFR